MNEIRVNFRPLIKEMEFLGKKLRRSRLTGENSSPFAQKDVEFEEFKPFSYGDDVHTIDWKASLRCNKLLIRKAIQRRNYNIFFLVDVSESMLYSTGDKLKCEYAAEIVAALSHYFLTHSESVGVALFNEKMVSVIPPNLGNNQFMKITSALSSARNYGGGFGLSHVLRRVESLLLPNSVVIIVSDFLGLDKNWKKAVEGACRRFDVRALIIRDAQDLSLNDRIGMAVVEDPFSSRKMLVDLVTAKESYDRNAKRQLEDVQRTFLKYRGESLLLNTTDAFVRPVMKFFSKHTWQ